MRVHYDSKIRFPKVEPGLEEVSVCGVIAESMFAVWRDDHLNRFARVDARIDKGEFMLLLNVVVSSSPGEQ